MGSAVWLYVDLHVHHVVVDNDMVNMEINVQPHSTTHPEPERPSGQLLLRSMCCTRPVQVLDSTCTDLLQHTCSAVGPADRQIRRYALQLARGSEEPLPDAMQHASACKRQYSSSTVQSFYYTHYRACSPKVVHARRYARTSKLYQDKKHQVVVGDDSKKRPISDGYANACMPRHHRDYR